jgi:hypothetical protein
MHRRTLFRGQFASISPKPVRPKQMLLGHTKLKSTVRYFGIEVDDALEIARSMDV